MLREKNKNPLPGMEISSNCNEAIESLHVHRIIFIYKSYAIWFDGKNRVGQRYFCQNKMTT